MQVIKMLNLSSGMNILRSGVFILFFFFIFSLLFGRAMGVGLSHDEYQFVASGQLLEQKGFLPYVDFPYLHMPYMPFFNALVFKLTNYDLLAARTFAVLCATLGGILLFSFANRILEYCQWPARYLVGGLAVFLFVTNPISIDAIGLALNHCLPTLLSLLAFDFYLNSSRKKESIRWIFLTGLLTGLSLGTRLSYAVLLLPFLSAVCLFPFQQTIASRLKRAFSFSLGVLLGLLPAIVLFLMAPKPFYYGNFVYIRLNTIYRQLMEFDLAMTMGAKLELFYQEILKHPINLLIYACALVFSIIALAKLVKTKERFHFEVAITATLSLFLLASAFVPTPLWTQYFFAPLPFLIIGLLYGLATLSRKGYLGGVFASLLFLTALINGTIPQMSHDLNVLWKPQSWQPVQIHNFAVELHSLVPEGKILTLAPILPLEGNADTYAMFAVGPFSWRTAHILSEEKRREYGIIAYTDLDRFLENDPPQAILVGLEENYYGFKRQDEGGLEKPFMHYATQHGFLPVDLPVSFADIHLDLWVR